MITCSLHNHCTLCDGRSSLADTVAAAERAGITDFGISCHGYIAADPVASVDDERSYIAAVRAFIAGYKGKMRLYLGVEEDLASPVKMRGEYDYIIGSNHYFEKDGKLYSVDLGEAELNRCITEAFGGNALAAAEEYFARVVKEAKSGPDIIGHFDLFRLYGRAFVDTAGKDYREIALSALDECLATGAIFELNYGGVMRKGMTFPYPEDFLLRRIKEKGGRVTITNDCHDARRIADGLAEGERLLRDYGFAEAAVLTPSGFASVKL